MKYIKNFRYTEKTIHVREKKPYVLGIFVLNFAIRNWYYQIIILQTYLWLEFRFISFCLRKVSTIRRKFCRLTIVRMGRIFVIQEILSMKNFLFLRGYSFIRKLSAISEKFRRIHCLQTGNFFKCKNRNISLYYGKFWGAKKYWRFECFIDHVKRQKRLQNWNPFHVRFSTKTDWFNFYNEVLEERPEHCFSQLLFIAKLYFNGPLFRLWKILVTDVQFCCKINRFQDPFKKSRPFFKGRATNFETEIKIFLTASKHIDFDTLQHMEHAVRKSKNRLIDQIWSK